MRRIYARVSALAIASVGLVALAYLLRGVILAPLVERFLEARLRNDFGLEARISSIGGTYVTSLVIDGLRTTSPGKTGPVEELGFKRLQIDFSPFSLLGGWRGFLAKTSISLKGGHLVLHPSRAAKGAEPSAPGSPWLPLVLPRTRVRDTSVSVRGDGYRIEVTGLGLDTEHRENGATDVALRVANAAWSLPGLKDGETPITADLTCTDKALEIRRVTVGGNPVVKTGHVDLEGLPDALSLDASFQSFGGAGEIGATMDGSSLELHWRISSLSAGRALAVTTLPVFLRDGDLDSTGKIRLDTKRSTGIAGDATLRLTGAKIRGATLEHAEALVSADQEVLRVERLDLQMGKNTGSIEDLTAPAPALFAGDLDQVVTRLTGHFSVHLEDIPSLLRATGVSAPPLAARLPAHSLTVVGRVGNRRIVVDRGRLAVDAGTVDLRRAELALPAKGRPLAAAAVTASLRAELPRLAPVASLLGLPPLKGSLKGKLEVEGTLRAPRGVAEVRANALEYGGTQLGELSFQVRGTEREVTLQSLELTRGPDRVSATGRLLVGTRRLEDVSLRATLRDLGAYDRLVPGDWTIRGKPVRIGGNLKARATAEGPWDRPDGTLEVEASDITFQQQAFGALALRAAVRPSGIEVEALRWHHDQDRLSGRGGYNLDTQSLDQASLQASVRDLGPYFRVFSPEASPLEGSVRANLTATGPLREPTGQLDVELKQLRVPGVDVDSGVLRAASAGRRIRVETMVLEARGGTVSLSGTITRSPTDTRFGIDLDTLTLSRHKAALHLKRPARLSCALSPACTVEGLALVGDMGEIRVDGLVSTRDPSDLTITVGGLKGGEWLDGLGTDGLSFQGLDARVHLWGTRSAPNASLAGTVANLTARNAPFPLSGIFDLGYTAKGIEIRRFDWSGQGGEALSAKGRIPIDLVAPEMLLPGDLSLEIEANVPQLGALGTLLPLRLAAGGSLRTTLAVRGTWDEPVGHMELRASGLNLPSSLKPAPPGPYAVVGELDVQGREVTLSTLDIRSAEAAATGSGRWSGAPTPAELLLGKAAMSGEVTAKVEFSIADVSWAAEAIPGVRRIGGKLSGEARLTGPARLPDFTATARLSEGEVRPASDVPGVDSLNLNLEAGPKTVRIEEARGFIGGAPFQAAGTIEKGSGGTWTVDTRFRGDNILLYRGNGVMARADVNVSVQGPVSHLAFSGEAAVTEGRFAKNIDILGALRGTGRPPSAQTGLQLFSIRTPPLKDATFDIHIASKNPFEIRTGVANGAVRPDLQLGGTGELPTLTGEVYVDTLKVSLPAGTLAVQSGVIRFLPSEPYRPRLDISATTTMMGYDITVTVGGPYDQPQIILSSVPPLPDEDLILLLLAGQPPKAPASRATAQRSGLNVAVYLGRNLLDKWFGDGSASGGSVFERVEVEVGREGVTQTGEQTLDAQILMARINDKTVYITAQRDLYDAYNVGLKIVFRFQ